MESDKSYEDSDQIKQIHSDTQINLTVFIYFSGDDKKYDYVICQRKKKSVQTTFHSNLSNQLNQLHQKLFIRCANECWFFSSVILYHWTFANQSMRFPTDSVFKGWFSMKSGTQNQLCSVFDLHQLSRGKQFVCFFSPIRLYAH